MKKMIFALVLLGSVALLFSSCSRKGYGCRGRESWGKMVRRINSGY